MCRTPAGSHDEPLEGPPPGDQVAVVLGGLGHEHVPVPAALGLDQLTGGRTADLLIRNQHDGHRQAGLPAVLTQQAQGVYREERAGLHVEHARPVQAVAVPLNTELPRERRGSCTVSR